MGAEEEREGGMGEGAMLTGGEWVGCMVAGMMGMLITPTLARGAVGVAGAEVGVDEGLPRLYNSHVGSMEQNSIYCQVAAGNFIVENSAVLHRVVDPHRLALSETLRVKRTFEVIKQPLNRIFWQYPFLGCSGLWSSFLQLWK